MIFCVGTGVEVAADKQAESTNTQKSSMAKTTSGTRSGKSGMSAKIEGVVKAVTKFFQNRNVENLTAQTREKAVSYCTHVAEMEVRSGHQLNGNDDTSKTLTIARELARGPIPCSLTKSMITSTNELKNSQNALKNAKENSRIFHQLRTYFFLSHPYATAAFITVLAGFIGYLIKNWNCAKTTIPTINNNEEITT